MKRRGGESGQAVIAVTIVLSLVLLTLLTMLTQVQVGNLLVTRQLTYQGQAANAAQAGLVDALSWFRRQSTQPVQTFAPAVNALATPPINDTEDTSIGIVRTYQVSVPSRLMGRYEVRKGVLAAGTGVLDVTSQKGKMGAGAGSVWQLESIGYIWVQNDSSKAFNVSPNTILSQQTFRTEIQKMAVALPDGGAALFSGNCDNVTIDTKTKIQGGPAIGVSCATVAPAGAGIKNNGIITGTTKTKTNSTAKYDIPSVFGVTQQELVGLADVYVTRVADLPSPLPSMSLIIINNGAGAANAAIFDNTRPLTGSGILVVFGDLTLTAGSLSFWNGVIYLTGNLQISEPSLVSGAVVIANSSAAAGEAINSGSDISEIDYSKSMIDQINSQMAQYRFSRAKYWIGK